MENPNLSQQATASPSISSILKEISVAAHIKGAIDQVYNGTKEPEQALDEAATKSAKVLGW